MRAPDIPSTRSWAPAKLPRMPLITGDVANQTARLVSVLNPFDLFELRRNQGLLHQAKNVNDPPTLQDLVVGEQVEAHHIACDTTLLIIEVAAQ